MKFHIPYPPPVHTCERAARFLKLLPIAAFLAAGAAQAENIWGVSIIGVDPSATTCADVKLRLKVAGDCSSVCFATGELTVEQGATEETKSVTVAFPSSFNYSLGSEMPLLAGTMDPAKPFTVTWTIGVGSTIFTDTKTFSGCVGPKITYTVTGTATPAAGGTFTCTSSPVAEGGETECSAVPNDAEFYTFTGSASVAPAANASVSCDKDTKKCTVSAVKGNVTVRGEFEKKAYEVQATATGGSVSCTPTLPAAVKHGDTVQCTAATPDVGNEFTSLTLGSEICTALPCSFTITSAGTITGTFTASSGGGGTPEFYYFTGVANPAKGGEVTCDRDKILHADSPTTTVTCTAKAKDGYELSGAPSVTKGAAATVKCEGTTCTLKGVTDDVEVSANFKEVGGGGGGSFAPAVVSINGVAGNKEPLQPGKANKVKFTLGNKSFNGDGTLKITDVTKSLQKASLGNETVSIKNGEFEADITPEEGEKTVTVNLTVKDTPVNQDFTFRVASGGGAVTGGASPVPTMSEIGLLLSGLALAGAAAPALRRRERKARKRA